MAAVGSLTADMTSGTMTFLFADLESSTRLWEQFPEAMPAAIERHDRIMRNSVEEANGRVVKTTGDGLMAVFESPADAVAGALVAQRRLLGEAWSETGPLRARLGLHSGQAHGREGDYFGPPVNRAARIMSAGHGGQVLLSGTTAELARNGLPAGTELRDLGEHRLKDLLQPERIFQLLHPDLPADLPPLITLGRRPHNLPIQYSELIGREDELRELRRLLESDGVRLITLTGPGGIGKTRLALQAAAEQIDRFADGVFFVDLSGARETDAALAAIVRTAGLAGRADQPLLELLKSELGQREILLVLDNFEQVMPAADAIGQLVLHCSEVRLLVTSREALRVRGEQLFPVAALSLPPVQRAAVSAATIADYEAVRLFIDRARAARPDFTLSDANAAAVLEICVRLDGLPLALELAAARLRLFAPAELAERLRRRLDVLRGGPRDVPQRQQTLRDTIAWSHDLLGDDERALFSLLSVFSGARVEAVEETAARAEETRHVDVVEALASLVDKSLVRTLDEGGAQRLSLLETIREYATERLESRPTLAAAARRAHAEYYSELALESRDAARGSREPGSFDDLLAELGNLETAWRHWLDARDLTRLEPLLDALWMVHETRGWYQAAINLASDLLAVLQREPASPDRLESELVLRMSLARGLLAVRGYSDEVEQLYRDALALAEAAGQLPRRLSVLRSLATFHLARGELAKTREIGEQILQLGEETGDDRLQVDGNFVVGVTTAFLGDVPAGQAHLQKTIALFDPARHGTASLRLGPSPAVAALTSSALLHWYTGQLAEAEERASDAVAVAEKLGHPYSLTYGRFHVGLYNAYNLRFDRARALAEGVLAVADEHDYAVWRAIGLVLLGVCLARLGRPAEGLARGEEGLARYRGLTTPPIFWPLILALQADTNGQAGRLAVAQRLIEEALALVTPHDIQGLFLLIQKGQLMAAAGAPDSARSLLDEAISRAERSGARTARLLAAMALVELPRTEASADDIGLLRSVLADFDAPDAHLLQLARGMVADG